MRPPGRGTTSCNAALPLGPQVRLRALAVVALSLKGNGPALRDTTVSTDMLTSASRAPCPLHGIER